MALREQLNRIHANKYVFLADGGHRRSWAETISGIAGCEVEFLSVKSLRHMISTLKCNKLYLLTLDDHLITSLILSLVRAIGGKRTFALYLGISRNLEARSFKSMAKRLMLFLLREIKLIEVVCIMPPGLSAAVDKCVNRHLVDLNCIDLFARGLIQQHTTTSSLKISLVAVGLQTERRGTALLLDSFTTNEDVRGKFAFQIIGKEAGLDLSLVDRFRKLGGFAQLQWADESYLIEQVAKADIVFCLFSPLYDQPSGVLGHAFQLGRPVLLRTGSVTQRYAEFLGVDYIACEFTADALHKQLMTFNRRNGSPANLRRLETFKAQWLNFLTA